MKFLASFLLILVHLTIYARSAFIWNTGGAAGIFMAIAVPIDLPHYNVFVSYNFEACYPLPRTWRKKPHGHVNGTHANTHKHQDDDYYYDYNEYDYGTGHHHHDEKKGSKIKQIKTKNHKSKKTKPSKPAKHTQQKPATQSENIDYKDFFEDFPIAGRAAETETETEAKRRIARSLLSRTNFYQILTSKFDQHGFVPAEQCLLRLICEVNSSHVGDINGVLGTLMHTMFSPSSSRYEALPERYYMAELLGRRDECSSYYHQRCKRSVFDLISRPLSDFIALVGRQK